MHGVAKLGMHLNEAAVANEVNLRFHGPRGIIKNEMDRITDRIMA